MGPHSDFGLEDSKPTLLHDTWLIKFGYKRLIDSQDIIGQNPNTWTDGHSVSDIYISSITYGGYKKTYSC